jgi:hypothetical protein
MASCSLLPAVLRPGGMWSRLALSAAWISQQWRLSLQLVNVFYLSLSCLLIGLYLKVNSSDCRGAGSCAPWNIDRWTQVSTFRADRKVCMRNETLPAHFAYHVVVSELSIGSNTEQEAQPRMLRRVSFISPSFLPYAFPFSFIFCSIWPSHSALDGYETRQSLSDKDIFMSCFWFARFYDGYWLATRFLSPALRDSHLIGDEINDCCCNVILLPVATNSGAVWFSC